MIKTLPVSRLFSIIAIVVSLLLVTGADAQQGGRQTIHLKNRELVTDNNAGRWTDSMNQLAKSNEPVQVLIHFTTLPTDAQRKTMAQNGISLLDYIPDNTFSAFVQLPLDKTMISSLPVHSILNTRAAWKADDRLWKSVADKKGAVEVLVSFYRNLGVAEIDQFITSIGARTDAGPMERYGNYKVIIAADKVASMAEWYGVRYISPVSKMVPLDLQSRPAVMGNVSITSAAYGGFGLMGDSVTVGVGDNSSGIYHADLKDRITNFNPGAPSHHGEFVNGIVGGAANVDPLSASITPHVSLVDFYFDLILPSTGAMYHDYNMTITNNSYEVIEGDCDYAGTYDAYAQLLDTLSVEYPYVQHVFASGNDGANDCVPFVQGFATVGGGYQPAKNDIVVGSMTDFLIESFDESRGPVKDGRLKPDIIAIGLGAYSTVDIDNYEWSAGTSMASPQVASGLAALTQHYKNLHGGTQPTADVLKTILLNGAQDLGNPGPDYSYGFGGMDLYRSLLIMDSNNYVTNTISNGDSQLMHITIPPNTGQVKIMLYWNDVPGSPAAAKELVNDLDLTVQDPALNMHLPLVLDPTPANVNNNATEQHDHLNNVEQVTINNPAAGTYTIKTKGYSVPSGPQQYVIAYDIIPNGLRLTYPIGGEQLSDVDSIRIFWDAVTDTNTFTSQYSTDNGVTWTTIFNNLAPGARYTAFLPTGINSGNCRVRMIRNNTAQVSTSQRFVINQQPVVTLDTAQCPGYVNIHWGAVPGAASYYLLKKVGFYMQVVDSTTGTSYSFGGLSLNEKSYVAVQPVLSGNAGYRSVAAIRQANTGNCTNPVSAGDLMLDSIIAPRNGRMYTSTQLGTGIQVQLRDLYSAPCLDYTLSCQVNGGPWQQLTSPAVIPANGTAIVNIPGLDFTAVGSYSITVAVHNLAATDPQPGNDTLSIVVLNLPNDTLNLSTAFADGFETLPKFSVTHDSIGVSPNGHWDYFNTNDSGQLRSFVDDDITISGNRSICLDNNQATTIGSMNTFRGTFNLQNYDTATTEIRVDFDYVLHGTPKSPDGNVVTARGNDTAGWAPFYSYDLAAYPGTLTHVQSLSLTDAVRLSNHNFSTSTQVSFGQNDTSLIAAASYGNGLTIDNFRLYTVANDAAITGIVTPLPTNCGLPSTTPLTVQVHNGVNYTLYNIQLFYKMAGGFVYTGIIDSIMAKATVNYTFAQELSVAAGSTNDLSVWLSAAGDTYTANDSILNYNFRNSVIVSSFPYLENLEANSGGYYTEGINDSWQYGTPASPKINKAASGTKAWKTNLTGNYNNLEQSYLYSPCFDLSSLSNPMLSFSTAMDIENCGTTLCDGAYIQYSFDGITWTKLGDTLQGTNWYTSPFDIWNTEGFTRWHVASILLPQPPVGGSIRFRFVMSADPGATFEGIAVDDIHIFDRNYSIYPANGVATAEQTPGNNQWNDYLQSGQVMASVQPNNQTIYNTTVSLYGHDTLYNPGATQYTFPRSYTIKSAATPVDSVGLRLYLLDSDVVRVLNDTTCPSCTRAPDAYSLGITKYENSNNPNEENGTLADDAEGTFTYYPYNAITWVPYDQGYYAQLNVKSFSEFWFNDGGPTGNFPAGIDYLNFIAFRNGSNVTAYWYSLIDTAVNAYTLQRSADSVNFTDILDTAATHSPIAQYAYDDPQSVALSSTLYYRLKWGMTGKSGTYYSPIRRVDNTDSAAGLVVMRAKMISQQSVLVNWTSYIDGVTSYYILERAIGNGNYLAIENEPAIMHYGAQYNFTDVPGELAGGTLVHYRLTAVLTNGNKIVLPVHTVEWTGPNTFVNVYPNPTTDGSFTIHWTAVVGTNMELNVTDAAGRSLFKTTVTATQWDNTTTVRTSDIARGAYKIKMDIGGTRSKTFLIYE